MKSISFSTFVLLFAGWAQAGWAAEPKAEDRAQMRLVLVSSDTWLHSAPDEKSYRFRVRGSMPVPIFGLAKKPIAFNPKDHYKRTLLFVFRGEVPGKPGWLHLRSLAKPQLVGNTCAHPTPGRGMVIDLYVRSDRLLETLKEPFSASYEDGTELRLLPGVVIRPTKRRGRYIAETPYLHVDLPLPPNSTTRTFTPRPGFAIDKAADWTATATHASTASCRNCSTKRLRPKRLANWPRIERSTLK